MHIFKQLYFSILCFGGENFRFGREFIFFRHSFTIQFYVYHQFNDNFYYPSPMVGIVVVYGATYKGVAMLTDVSYEGNSIILSIRQNLNMYWNGTGCVLEVSGLFNYFFVNLNIILPVRVRLCWRRSHTKEIPSYDESVNMYSCI